MPEGVRGQIASRGTATGRVKIVMNFKNNKKVKKGNIIVSAMTTPAFMPAIKRKY